jgi:hypothetical protein
MSVQNEAGRIEEALSKAIQYLGRNQREDGMYAYAMNAKTGQPVPAQYGHARHIGTLYSLARSIKATGLGSDVFNRGLSFVKATMLAEVEFPSGAKHIVVRQDGSSKVSLNATALLACAVGEKLLGDAEDGDLELFKHLLRAIGAMQRSDGMFFKIYDPDLQMFEQPFDVCASGEACLALTYGVSILGKQPWLSMCQAGISNLISVRPLYSARPYVESFWWSWVALTLCRLYPFTMEPIPEGEKPFTIQHQFYLHMLSVCEQAMVANKEVPFHDQMNMSIASSNLTTIWNMYKLLTITEREENEWMVRSCFLPRKLWRWGLVGLLLVCDSQVTSGTLDGGIPFVFEGSQTIRVDTISHFIDACLAALDCLKRT